MPKTADPNRTYYTRSRRVRGSRLKPGMWLSLPERLGACIDIVKEGRAQ